MTNKNLLLCLVLLGVIACSSKESVVNPGVGSLMLVPASPADTGYVGEKRFERVTEDVMKQAPTTAIEGKVLLDGDIPVPLSRILIGIYRKDQNRWHEITRLTTETDGGFRITQKLTGGFYQVRILDSRFQGEMPVTLEDRPATGLILQATRK